LTSISNRNPKYLVILDAQVKRDFAFAARAFRWREMLANDTHATITEITAAERMNDSYVGRVLRLTMLASDIVEAILNERVPAGPAAGRPDAAISSCVAGAAPSITRAIKCTPKSFRTLEGLSGR
jgi:hypothetical protein